MNGSILLPLHRRAGARLVEAEPGKLITYGDVPAEYRAAQEGCAVFDATDRGLVAVAGAEAAEFLHRLLSNSVRDLESGHGNRNLLLTPKGKVRHEFDLSREREGEGFRLSTPPGDAEGLAHDLDTYLFAEDVKIEDRTDRHAPLRLRGPRAPEVARSVAGLAPPETGRATVVGTFAGGPVRVTPMAVLGAPGVELEVEPERTEELWGALLEAGAVPAGIAVRDIVRVEACSALFGEDVDENVYPQEARLEDAFSLDKGCYIGQEVVAKIDTYGGLNKRLCALACDHDDPVPRGTRLYREDGAEWRDLGVVTSWAYSFVHDTGLVLAYLKRKHQEPGTTFRVGEGPGRATVVEV